MLKFNEYFPTVMECLSDGKSHTSREIRDYCCEKLAISDEEKT